MAYTTHIQQVLAYLKQGHKLQPPAGTPIAEATPPAGGPFAKPAAPTAPAAAPPKAGM